MPWWWPICRDWLNPSVKVWRAPLLWLPIPGRPGMPGMPPMPMELPPMPGEPMPLGPDIPLGAPIPPMPPIGTMPDPEQGHQSCMDTSPQLHVCRGLLKIPAQG